MTRTLKSGLTNEALLRGRSQSITVWDCTLTLDYIPLEDRYRVAVLCSAGEGYLVYAGDHRRLDMARRDFLKQVHRHFGQQLAQAKKAHSITCEWKEAWFATAAGKEVFHGVTKEAALLRAWGYLCPPPSIKPFYHYDRFWTRPRKPTLTVWTCSNGHQTNIYRASDPRGYSGEITCRHCGVSQSIEVKMNGEVHGKG